jgi:spore coat polysaccharide biosynthesis protein SpsF (cytidylyltransferase family)
MITAIINARTSSERFPLKHLKKIGNKSIIEHIIYNLNKVKYLKKIYIASGKKKKNFLYEKYVIKNKIKGIKFFYSKDENNVTKRIYDLTKKIKTKYTVLISGDCPLIEPNFINRLLKQLMSKSKYDFIYSKKKIIHEGIKLFKTKSWEKVYKLSKEKKYLEHPGYIVKKRPKQFTILKYIPEKYENGKKIRLSVDTESDLDFFKYTYYTLKNKNKNFNLKNLLRINKIKILNKHVLQRNPFQKKYKVIILTAKDISFGLGHYKRSEIIKREISERLNSSVEIVPLDFTQSIFKIYKKLKNLNLYDLKIIDLPELYLNRIKDKIKNLKRTIIIDKILNYKNLNYYIPNLILNKKIRGFKVYGGIKYVIVNRKIILENLIKIKKKKIKKLLLIGGSYSVDPEIIKFMNVNKKNLTIVLGNLVKDKITNDLKMKGFTVIRNPDNLFEIIKSSKEIYCRFGLTAFEVIALKKKPVIFSEYNQNDNKVINELYKKNYINIFNRKKRKQFNNFNINSNLNNLINVIKNCL